tara:strand:- start:150 stop:797 length:648 start_codon:yes stop_codon:yes gene_type:complete
MVNLLDEVQRLKQANIISAAILAQKTAEMVKLQRENEELRKLVHTDRLTGLRTREFFELEFERHRPKDRVLPSERISSQNTGLGLAFVDVDKFKSINDNYGHLHGDKVLVAIATLLTEKVRSTDLVVRWGGDEFLILFPRTSIDGLNMVSEQIRTAVEALKFGFMDRSVAVSIGLTHTQVDHPDLAKAMIKYADDAMYEAKRTGSNRVVFGQKIP